METKIETHKDGCAKFKKQIVEGECTCSRWIKIYEPDGWGYTREICPDGSGHCKEHCYFGQLGNVRD